MATIQHITLLWYRNYASNEFSFPTGITAVTGPNGCGKTNLLDAVYYLCYTKSYFSGYQHSCVQTGQEGFRLTGVFVQGEKTEHLACKWQGGKKELLVDGREYEKITDHIGRYSSVMIAPDDIELVNGASDLRRKWVDGILSQTDHAYLEQLLLYQRVLQQRNAWLKQQAVKQMADWTEIDYYNLQLNATGGYIHHQRAAFIASFEPMLNDLYHYLSGGAEMLTAAYSSDLFAKPLGVWLEQTLQHDLAYQRTLRGVHKDDWDFRLNDLPLKQYGSQGQKKSFLFALKLAQFQYLSARLHKVPILLLDDIFEKLDQKRIEALLSIIKGKDFGQVILTDTHADRVRQAFGNSMNLGFINL